jgi:O-antigen/teichoic acid export membrane protein
LASQTTGALREVPLFVLRTVRNPLLRNGHLLTLSSGFTGLIGLAYWALTAWRYAPDSVGRNSAAISMMMLLAAIAQLDLSTAMVRFVPGAGRHTRRLVACTYLIAGSLAVLVSLSFVAIAPRVSPGVTYFDHPLAGAGFVVATLAYTLFVVQDGVLTGLRRTAWVPVENTAFGVAKVGVVLVVASALPKHGIFVSWLLPLAATVVIVGVLLFGSAIPRHQRAAPSGTALTPPAEIVRFVMAGYVGAVCSIASMTLMPILVIKVLGAAANAGFAIAWVMAYSLHLVNINMGASLVVETAADRAGLGRSCRQVLAHIGRLLVPAVIVVVVCAPYLLAAFGPAYAAAIGALRLLSLASLPHLLVVIAISSARVRRRMGVVVLIQATQCVLALGLGWVLLPIMGLTGVGLGWLLTQSLAAGVLLVRRDLWLPAPDGEAGTDKPAMKPPRSRRHVALLVGGMRVAAALGQRERLSRLAAWRRERHGHRELQALLPALLSEVPAVPGQAPPYTWTSVAPVGTVTDLSVAFLSPPGYGPAAVLKVAQTGRAAGELRAQRVTLGGLSSDPALARWRALLPRVLLHRDDGVHALVVETFLPGTDLATRLSAGADRDDNVDDAAVAAALDSINQLHQLTGRTELVNDDHLRRWVDAPLDQLRESCAALTPPLLATVDELGATLRRALAGAHMPVSWTHGDFTPANVLISGGGREVSGIVDWGGARRGQPSPIDSYLLLLCACCYREGLELGEIVCRMLLGGGLPSRDRDLLAKASGRRTCEPSGDPIDERVLILLAWLHHVAELRRKCGLYRENGVWWAFNGAPVLRAAAGMSQEVGRT